MKGVSDSFTYLSIIPCVADPCAANPMLLCAAPRQAMMKQVREASQMTASFEDLRVPVDLLK